MTERCANTLISVRDEIADAGFTVAEELQAPIAKLVECVLAALTSPHILLSDFATPHSAFGEVHHFLKKLGHRPFLKRYLRRDEILISLAQCDSSLNEALGMFGVRVVFPPANATDTDALDSSLSRSAL